MAAGCMLQQCSLVQQTLALDPATLTISRNETFDGHTRESSNVADRRAGASSGAIAHAPFHLTNICQRVPCHAAVGRHRGRVTRQWAQRHGTHALYPLARAAGGGSICAWSVCKQHCAPHLRCIAAWQAGQLRFYLLKGQIFS